MSLNTVIEQGRICTDITVRYTQSQKPVTSFRIAVDDGYGENKKSYFLSCVAWGKVCDFISNHFNKGDPIIVEGKLQTREWTDKQGQKRTETEINVSTTHFCGSKQSGENRPQTQYNAASRPVNVSADDFAELDDDELPGELPF